MKKIIVLLAFLFLSLPAFSFSVTEEPFIAENTKPIEAGITFDWISKTQLQRDENIKQIQNMLFDDNTIMKYSKKDFKEKYSSVWTDSEHMKNYEEIMNGKKEDESKYYCGFYWDKLLVAYGVQFKNKMDSVYYYDAMGNLRWVDVFSSGYPKFPYWSYQYYKTGEMVAAYYYVSEYDQYVFDADKNFKGRWYKENMYNKKAKVIMSRTNYGQKD